MKKSLMHIALALFIAGFITILGVNTPKANANGDGSPVACSSNPNVNPNASKVLGDQGGDEDELKVDVGAGNEVTGVCIKSGNKMFSPDKHSPVLGNGTYEDGCYTVSGVGTQVVTVERNFGGDDCQALSHIDVLFEEADGECEENCNPCENNCNPCDNNCNPCEDNCEPECETDCEEPETPTTPETPGQVLGTSTPTGGVNAGAGPAAGSLIGLSTSLSAIAYGIRRFHKND